MTEPPAPEPPAAGPVSQEPPPYGAPPAAPTIPSGDPTAFYGTPPPGMYYDPQSGLTLPQGVALASVGRRIGAYFLAIPLFVVTLGIGYLIWGLILWGRGTSPALSVLGMRCWHPDSGKLPGFWRMALRDVVGRFIDGVLSIITELISFVMFVSSNDRKSLHDAIAGTVVVHDPNGVLNPRG